MILAAARQLAFAMSRGVSLQTASAEAPAERSVTSAQRRYTLRAVPASAALCDVEGAVLISLGRVEAAPLTDDALRAEWGLTPREIEVVRLLARGCSNAEVASALGVSAYTARNHTERALLKLGVTSRGRVGPLLRGEAVASVGD